MNTINQLIKDRIDNGDTHLENTEDTHKKLGRIVSALGTQFPKVDNTSMVDHVVTAIGYVVNNKGNSWVLNEIYGETLGEDATIKKVEPYRATWVMENIGHVESLLKRIKLKDVTQINQVVMGNSLLSGLWDSGYKYTADLERELEAGGLVVKLKTPQTKETLAKLTTMPKVNYIVNTNQTFFRELLSLKTPIWKKEAITKGVRDVTLF